MNPLAWLGWLWPRSLRGQMIVLVLVGLSLAQVCGYIIYRSQQQSELQALRDEFVLGRIVAVARLLSETPAELHQRIVLAASSEKLSFTLTEQPTADGNISGKRAIWLRRKLAVESGYDVADIHVELEKPIAHRERYDDDDRTERRVHRQYHRDRYEHDKRKKYTVLAIALRLGSKRWLNANNDSHSTASFWQWSTLLSAGSAALILSLLLVFMVRRITRPLAGLTTAAESFGRGEATVALAEQGPGDIRDTIHAFNLMRTRLQRFVQDRTQMLAAISHDLRTPIAALRVRAELIEEPDTRNRILTTLDEMQHMIETTLDFVREDAAQEQTRLVDINALIESVCDDLSDTGADVSFNGPGKTPYRCRSLSLKRALRNLIENGVRYGKRVGVTLNEGKDLLIIQIHDDGPGIAESEQERVFEPFVRLETSRNLGTGGVGLGLAIARSIIRRHGGDIVLENQPPGGLMVIVTLPDGK